MVTTISVAGLIFNSLICFLVPVVISICLLKKDKELLSTIIVGVLIFFLFQLALKIPLCRLISSSSFYGEKVKNIWLDSIIMGVLYGIFGEMGKIFGFKFFLKNHNKWQDGIALGVGYGGIGVIYSSGLNEAFLLILTKVKGFEYTEAIVGQEKLGAILDKFEFMNNIELFIKPLNQVLFMIIQVALSILILYALNNKKYIYIFIAILFDLIIYIVYINLFIELDWNILSISSILLILAGFSMIFIVKSEKLFLVKDRYIKKKINECTIIKRNRGLS